MLLVVAVYVFLVFFFVFKQKTAYEMRISDWSSDVCSSDLSSSGAKTEIPCSEGERCSDGEVHSARSNVELIPNAQSHSSAGRCPLKQCQIGRASCRERVCQYV